MGSIDFPSTRSAAIASGSTHYFTGKPCKRGHLSVRLTSNADCMGCAKERQAGYIANNREYFREKHRISSNKLYATNPLYRERQRAWVQENKERLNERRREIWSTPQRRIEHTVSSVVRRSLKGEKSGRRTFEILGYTPDEMRAHLESLFKAGMTWDNYGRDGWHIDHKIPLSAHNYKTPDDIDFKRAWALSNLQPLWALDNLKKSDSLDGPFQPSLALALTKNHQKKVESL